MVWLLKVETYLGHQLAPLPKAIISSQVGHNSAQETKRMLLVFSSSAQFLNLAVLVGLPLYLEVQQVGLLQLLMILMQTSPLI